MTRQTMKIEPDPRDPFPPRPSRELLAQLRIVRARTVDPNSGGVIVGGEFIGADARTVNLDTLRKRSPEHLERFLYDERIEIAGVS